MSLEKRLLAEEAELETLLFSQDDPEKSTDPTENLKVDTFDLDEIEEETTELAETIQDTKVTEEEKKTKQSWKQRFINFKTSSDKTIHNLRKDNTNLATHIGELRKEIDRLSSKIASMTEAGRDVFDGVITQEDIDIVGSESIDIVKKATKKAADNMVAPLREELQNLKARELAQIKKDAEAKRIAEYNEFISDLGNAVPDYAVINLDPKFEEYMMGIDESTGEKRLDVFRRAEEYLDAYRVADFFLDYKASIPKSKREILEDKVGLTGSSAGSFPKQKVEEVFSMKEVQKFYDDEAKGVYRGRQQEANAIDARITKAFIEGRIKD